MIFRRLTTTTLCAALLTTPALRAQADAGDFIGGAILGAIVGSAVQGSQGNRGSSGGGSRPGIPATQVGRDTQTALNYFGFNAGVVDGQIGGGTRQAIERYQATMGYPVNGRDYPNYQYDQLMQAYYWAINGGSAQTGLSGQPLLIAYRNNGGAIAPQPQPQPQPQVVVQSPPQTIIVTPPASETPATTVVASGETSGDGTPSVPNLFGGASLAPSLATFCNQVSLQTSSNGGYTTLANMSDADSALGEQLCLARSYAMAQGDELMANLQGISQDQIASQCATFTQAMGSQIDALSLNPYAQVEADMRAFALGTGIAPADLSATSKVCLAVGYRTDDMRMAVGSGLMLVALGETAYGEFLGHHLSQGFGASERTDLAVQWYQASLSALDGGASDVIMPGQPDRREIVRAAVTQLSGSGDQTGLFVPQPAQSDAAAPQPATLVLTPVAEEEPAAETDK